MPVLMSTPDMSAEMLLGAAGCASGSQTWSGMMPALTPKPTKKSTKSSVARRRADASAPASSASKRQRAGRRTPARRKPAIRQPGADVRHDEVEKGRAPAVAVLVLGGHQRGVGERHQLPREQERDRVGRREHELDGADQHVEGDAHERRPPPESCRGAK